MGAPSTAALTDDGGRPPDPRDHGGPVPGCHSIVPTALFARPPTPDLPPSTGDKLVTTIPIALPRATTPVMNNAAASVSTSTGGLLSLTEPIMEINKIERIPPLNRDQPPCSIPPTGRGHPGVCAEPLRLDDGGCVTLLDATVPVEAGDDVDPTLALQQGVDVGGGWLRYWDDVEGANYYFHEESGETRWEHPRDDVSDRVVWRGCMKWRDGDSCEHCPGWRRFWHGKLQRPFWYHLAEGGTWRRPDGWRGTDYPVERMRRTVCRNLLLRSFRWWENAAVERMRRTVCQNLRLRSFRHWAWLVEDEDDDACWAHLDYASD